MGGVGGNLGVDLNFGFIKSRFERARHILPIYEILAEYSSNVIQRIVLEMLKRRVSILTDRYVSNILSRLRYLIYKT